MKLLTSEKSKVTFLLVHISQRYVLLFFSAPDEITDKILLVKTKKKEKFCGSDFWGFRNVFITSLQPCYDKCYLLLHTFLARLSAVWSICSLCLYRMPTTIR